MNFASSFVLLGALLLLPACAGSAGRPAQSARVAEPSGSAPSRGQAVELRHFYLLSPGPNATLVVTRSDVSAPAP